MEEGQERTTMMFKRNFKVEEGVSQGGERKGAAKM